MKKFIFLFLVGQLFISCSSDSDSSGPTFSNTPQAKSQFDNKNYGIYKGVFVGSSGHVLINIKNEGLVSATLNIDGTVYNFTTTESVSEGIAISGLTFTSGGFLFDFNVNADGSDPWISNINILGHPNADMDILKELSTALVMCYQGTYAGDDSGVFNMITQSGEVYGLAMSGGDSESTYLEGLISGSAITGEFWGGSFSGTINGNSVSGNWQNTSLESGTWSGVRTL